MVGNGRPVRKVVDGHHQLMYWFFDEIRDYKKANKVSQEKLMARAGLGDNSILAWRRGRMPTIGNFEAACNVMGYRLTVVKIDEKDSP